MTNELMVLPPHIEAKTARAVRIKGAGIYADWPGTGPGGETCGSCKHCWRGYRNRYRKCRLVELLWTNGKASDIKARSAACSKWEKV
jgi:hypothetical protein